MSTNKRLYDESLPEVENEKREQRYAEELAALIAYEKGDSLAEALIRWCKRRDVSRTQFVTLVNSTFFKKRLREYFFATEFLPKSRDLVAKRIEAAVSGQPRAREAVFDEYFSEKKRNLATEEDIHSRGMNVVVAVLEKGLKSDAPVQELEPETSLPPMATRDPVQVVDAELVQREPPPSERGGS